MTATKPDVCPFGLYTGREAARLMGVDRHTITRWKREGELVPHTDNGRYRGKDIVDAWKRKI
jgi:excisionase family DNA binding protein